MNSLNIPKINIVNYISFSLSFSGVMARVFPAQSSTLQSSILDSKRALLAQSDTSHLDGVNLGRNEDSAFNGYVAKYNALCKQSIDADLTEEAEIREKMRSILHDVTRHYDGIDSGTEPHAVALRGSCIRYQIEHSDSERVKKNLINGVKAFDSACTNLNLHLEKCVDDNHHVFEDPRMDWTSAETVQSSIGGIVSGCISIQIGGVYPDPESAPKSNLELVSNAHGIGAMILGSTYSLNDNWPKNSLYNKCVGALERGLKDPIRHGKNCTLIASQGVPNESPIINLSDIRDIVFSQNLQCTHEILPAMAKYILSTHEKSMPDAVNAKNKSDMPSAIKALIGVLAAAAGVSFSAIVYAVYRACQPKADTTIEPQSNHSNPEIELAIAPQ